MRWQYFHLNHAAGEAFTMNYTFIKRVTYGASLSWLLLSNPALAGTIGKEGNTAMKLESKAFDDNGVIPARYTCDDQDISPDLTWSALPGGAQSLALIVDDPDAPDPAAPRMTWVHWILYNIPPDAGGLAAAVSSNALPAGTREGINDWGRSGYGGPCPPIGQHRYFHKLYALDTVLPDLGNPKKSDIEHAMEGHILGQAELIGTYQRAK